MNGDENGKAMMFVGVFQRTTRKEVLLVSLFDELAVSPSLVCYSNYSAPWQRLAAACSGRQDRSKVSAFCGEVAKSISAPINIELTFI